MANPRPVYRAHTPAVITPQEPSRTAPETLQNEPQNHSFRLTSPIRDETIPALAETQLFIETQISSTDEEPLRSTQNEHRRHPSTPRDNTSEYAVEDAIEPSDPQNLSKKRKLESHTRVDSPRPSSDLQATGDQPKTFVDDLLDFNEVQDESSGVLGNNHPPLDPYEGTLWAGLDRPSVRIPDSQKRTYAQTRIEHESSWLDPLGWSTAYE